MGWLLAVVVSLSMVAMAPLGISFLLRITLSLPLPMRAVAAVRARIAANAADYLLHQLAAGFIDLRCLPSFPARWALLRDDDEWKRRR